MSANQSLDEHHMLHQAIVPPGGRAVTSPQLPMFDQGGAAQRTPPWLDADIRVRSMSDTTGFPIHSSTPVARLRHPSQSNSQGWYPISDMRVYVLAALLDMLHRMPPLVSHLCCSAHHIALIACS